MTVPSTQREIQTTQYSGHYANNGVVSVIAACCSKGSSFGVSGHRSATASEGVRETWIPAKIEYKFIRETVR